MLPGLGSQSRVITVFQSGNEASLDAYCRCSDRIRSCKSDSFCPIAAEQHYGTRKTLKKETFRPDLSFSGQLNIFWSEQKMVHEYPWPMAIHIESMMIAIIIHKSDYKEITIHI